MTEPRFIVTELVGYPITDRPDGRGVCPTASYHVQATLNLYHVVRTYLNYHGRGRKYSQSKAERYCARLNKAWEAECARG